MKPSTIKKYLLAAGVPSELHDQAILSISLAKERAKGLVWIKWKRDYSIQRKSLN